MKRRHRNCRDERERLTLLLITLLRFCYFFLFFFAFLHIKIKQIIVIFWISKLSDISTYVCLQNIFTAFILYWLYWGIICIQCNSPILSVQFDEFGQMYTVVYHLSQLRYFPSPQKVSFCPFKLILFLSPGPWQPQICFMSLLACLSRI